MPEIPSPTDTPGGGSPSPAGESAVTGRKIWRAGTLTYSTTSLAVLFFWLLWGDFGFYLKDRAVPPTLQLLLRHFESSDLLVGLLLATLPQAISILIGPVVAYRSDRHRGRWGRRIPFLFVPTPFAFLAMVWLAYSPQLGRALHLLLGRWSPGEPQSIVLMLAAAWTLFEISAIICNAVFTSLIADVVPQKVIGRFFGLFRVVSLTAGILFSYYLLGMVEEHYFAIFVGIGLVYGVTFTAMCLRVKEGSYPPLPNTDEGQEAKSKGALLLGGVRTYCRDSFSVGYYRWLYVVFALSNMMFVPINLFAIFYAKQLGMSMATLGKLGALQLFLSLLQAYPTGWLADRFHPLRLNIAAIILVVISAAAAFFFVHDRTSFAVAYVGVGTLAGFWATSFVALPTVLFAREKFATLDSARNVVTALGMMVAGPACGWVLDLLNHDYHYIYLWSLCVGIVTLILTLRVYRQFVKHGGVGAYVAP